MFGKQRSRRDQSLIDAAARAGNQELAESLDRRRNGDWLDRGNFRQGIDDASQTIILVAGLAMFWGELNFGWFAGNALFPGLLLGEGPTARHWGGLLTCANSVLFVLLVFRWRSEKLTLKESLWSGWFWSMVASAVFALFSVYVSQTNAADEIRVLVEKKETLASTIEKETSDLTKARHFQDSLDPIVNKLHGAQDEAVGWSLNVIDDAKAEDLCTSVIAFKEHMACVAQAKRDSINCTRDVEPKARDVCNRIELYTTQVAAWRAEDAALMKRETDNNTASKQLAAMPEASNAFVRTIANLTKWEIQDAQSRIYVGLAVIFLLLPAMIFAMTLERRSKKKSGAQPSPAAQPQPGGTI